MPTDVVRPLQESAMLASGPDQPPTRMVTVQAPESTSHNFFVVVKLFALTVDVDPSIQAHLHRRLPVDMYLYVF